MAKAIYGKYSCNSKVKFLPPTLQSIRKKWYEYPNGGESSTTIWYFRSYTFDENNGFLGTSKAGSGLKLNDGSGSWMNPAVENVYMYITTTEAPTVTIYDSASNCAEIISAHQMVSEKTTVYSKGGYITEVIADYESLPADGKHSDGYWYTFVKMASDLKCNIAGPWKDAPAGWVNSNGIWKPQSELKASINGIFK